MHKSRFTSVAVLLVSVGLIPMTISGCTGSSPRTQNNADAFNEIDPAIAYSKRQREGAIEHYTRASKLHLEGKADEALIEYRKTLELDNQLYAAWNNMGQLLLEQGNYSDAVSAYRIASGLEPTDPRPEYNIGLAYQRVGWAQDSLTYFDNALERDPNYQPALRGMIRSAEMLGLADARIMSIIRNAQLRETEEQWRDYLSTQYYRVQAILDD
jgi:tetratricopeptide (TPR) repeat protein